MKVSATDIQKSYRDLYKEVRNYIWPFDTIEKLVDLELAAYKAIPDIFEVQNALSRFRGVVYDVARDDLDLMKKLDAFQDLIRDATSVYAKLNQVNEVVK